MYGTFYGKSIKCSTKSSNRGYDLEQMDKVKALDIKGRESQRWELNTFPFDVR